MTPTWQALSTCSNVFGLSHERGAGSVRHLDWRDIRTIVNFKHDDTTTVFTHTILGPR